MKAFVVSDMEGGTGITHGDQIHAKGLDYGRARKWLTGDVNAAVQGAFDAGADLVRVSDGHGNMRNLLLEEIDPRAEVLCGMALEREVCQLETLDGSFDVVLCVAYHAKAGTPDGVLAHTWIGGIVREFCLNGNVVGETGIAAATAGSFGVPIGMVAGDAAVCREAKELLGQVETVAVKKGLDHHLALCLPPKTAQARIRDAAKRAVEKAGQLKPYTLDSPTEVTIRLSSPALARMAARGEGIDLHGDDGIRLTRDSVRAAVASAWQVCYRAALEQGAMANW